MRPSIQESATGQLSPLNVLPLGLPEIEICCDFIYCIRSFDALLFQFWGMALGQLKSARRNLSGGVNYPRVSEINVGYILLAFRKLSRDALQAKLQGLELNRKLDREACLEYWFLSDTWKTIKSHPRFANYGLGKTMMEGLSAEAQCSGVSSGMWRSKNTAINWSERGHLSGKLTDRFGYETVPKLLFA